MNPLSNPLFWWLLLSPLRIENPSYSHRLILIRRQASQEGGQWNIIYKLKYCGEESIELLGQDIDLEYEAWVANSALPPHTIPKKSAVKFSLAEINSAQNVIIDNSNDRYRCKERISIAFSTNQKSEEKQFKGKMYWIPLRLNPQQEFWCYINLAHEHFLYEKYDPLLGERRLKIRFGKYYFFDIIPLNQEHYSAQSDVRLSKIPDERLDIRQFHSAPDSLYLATDIPGFQYFRFDDAPVKYGSQLRLSFYYLIAHGTDGHCHARVMEYQDTPNAWYRLNGAFDEQLAGQGHWRKFEQIFCVSNNTTTIALDFRIVEANIGEMWIDDVILELAEKAQPQF